MAGCALKTRGTEGFTLVEIMVALTILAFGLLGVVGLFVSAIGGNAQGRKVTEATSIAQGRLDEVVNTTAYLNMPDEAGVEHGLNALGRPNEPGETYPAFYNLTTYFEPITTMSGVYVDMYRATAICYWVTKGKRHEVKFETLRAAE